MCHVGIPTPQDPWNLIVPGDSTKYSPTILLQNQGSITFTCTLTSTLTSRSLTHSRSRILMFGLQHHVLGSPSMIKHKTNTVRLPVPSGLARARASQTRPIPVRPCAVQSGGSRFMLLFVQELTWDVSSCLLMLFLFLSHQVPLVWIISPFGK